MRTLLKPSLVVLATATEGRAAFLVAATPDLVSSGVNAGKLVGDIARVAGGGGGGRPDMATAGAKDASKLPIAMEEARRLAAATLGGG